MKIVRFADAAGDNAATRWGVVEDGSVLETDGPGGKNTGVRFAMEQVNLKAPAEPTKIICVGRNYVNHIREMENDAENLPAEPGLFMKGPNALADPGVSVPYPNFTREFHYEGELAVVMAARTAAGADVLGNVLGFTAAIDLTAREPQRNDLQWIRAKSADMFCPLGPWLETDIDPFDTTVRTIVNGRERQHGSTTDMLFPVKMILEYITSFMTLEKGDVVLTGTPEGVDELNEGDKVEVHIGGLGTPLAMSVGGSRS
ncbi:MAG: fumarylacetoacetate hydrolase family protein [Synergistota bacterium]|nr:fumarylacetoacetate hydrolase family protein [Synergistota bacterium]